MQTDGYGFKQINIRLNPKKHVKILKDQADFGAEELEKYLKSKKLENLKAAVALYFAQYNFCRIHGSLRVTPAMEAGLTDHVWTLMELMTADC